MDAAVARRMWSLLEPIHAVTYFTDAAHSAFESAGLRGFWRGYFAGRAAPLGAVEAGPVVGLFFNFSPVMVERALPDVWSRATPERALQARLDGSVAVLRPLVTEDVTAVAVALREVVASLDVSGRALGAANAALPWPDDPLAAVWHAATVLREHRGDGHVAALVTAQLHGCEAVAWRGVLDGNAETLRAARGWTEHEWAAAIDSLITRGWIERTGQATDRGRRCYQDIENVTDQLAAAPWRRLGETRTTEVADALRPLALAAAALLPYPNPVGLPQPS